MVLPPSSEARGGPPSARRSISPLPATGGRESSCWRCLEMLIRTLPKDRARRLARPARKRLVVRAIVPFGQGGCPGSDKCQDVGGLPKKEPADRAAGSCDTHCLVQIRSGYGMVNLPAFGIFTFGSVCAFITSFSPMILLSERM